MRALPFFLVLGLVTACAAHKPNDRRVAFVSKRATEARLTFSHHVELLSRQKPSMEKAKEQIESQVQHLFGPMERAESMAAPKEDHKITNVKIAEKSAGVYDITYDYDGTIVLEKGPRKHLDFVLPINPDKIYEAGFVGRVNKCTDEHYQSEGDFWYFWSPAPTYKGCPLEEGKDYEVVKGDIERIAIEAKTTYPEYDRLADRDGSIPIDLYFGMDDPAHSHDVARSQDLSAQTFRAARKQLEKLGYEFHTLSNKQLREIAPRGAPLPHVEVAEQNLRGTKIRIQLFFGETGIDEKSTPFHHFLKDTLENSAVFLYDGHSGLGGHLDLADIAKKSEVDFSLPKNRYQIYFFNSCTSYTYYNTLYFQRKRKNGRQVDAKGTENLDILANGLATDFDDEQNTNLALVRAIHNWAAKGTWTSYQNLARKIDTDNLFTVNGDEDNPTKPRR